METREYNIGKKNAYLLAYRHENLEKLGCAGEYHKKRPAMLVIPGGGYSFVSPREADPVAFEYFRAGFDCFILHYSCLEDIRESLPEEEAAEALALIASLEGIDGDRIAAVGFSAGGHLAASIAAHKDRYKVSLKALVLSYPVITMGPFTHEGSMLNITGGNEDSKRYFSIEKEVTPDFPPTYVWTTADDASVPVDNSLLLYSALLDSGVYSELHIYPHGSHGLSLATRETGFVNEHVSSWLEESLRFLDIVMDLE